MKFSGIIKVSHLFLSAFILCVFIVTLVYGAVEEDIKLKLKRVREDLRLSEETEERIAAELMRLRKSGQASPETLQYYETYLTRVQEMVKENQRAVKEMEQAYARHDPTSPVSKGSSEIPSALDMELDKVEELDEVVRLDRQLNESLAEFDEMLLKELDVLALEIEQIRARTARRMQELAGEAAEAARQARQSSSNASLSSYGYGYGDEMDSEQDETAQGRSGNQSGQQGGQSGQSGQQGGQSGQKGQQSGQSGQSGQQGGQSGQSGQQGGQSGQSGQRGNEGQQMGSESGVSGQSGTHQGNGTEQATGPGGHGAGAKGGGVGTDIPQKKTENYDGQDDDIVARQLREAAENETDPVLKEKLWKEYYEYKSGQ
jgi:hypothetical protein